MREKRIRQAGAQGRRFRNITAAWFYAALFLAAWAVVAVYASVDALVFYEMRILGGSHPSLALARRCVFLVAAGFLGYLAFASMQERLRAPLAGLTKAALSSAIILSPQMLLSSPM